MVIQPLNWAQKRFNAIFFKQKPDHLFNQIFIKTSQELRMLSSVTINCQVTKIVMNSGSQLSEL